MASRRGLQVLLVMLLLLLAGCAEQTPTTAQAPASPAPPPRPTEATPPAAQPAPPPSAAPVVAAPAPPPQAPAPPAAEPPRTAPQEFVEEPALKDVFFESGHTEIGRQGTVIMRGNAGWLIEHSTVLVLIEGHSDWKGPADANMAVGERRALAARDFLVKAGVSDSRIQVVSHGSERPVCPQRTEACAARNRRVHFLVTSK